MTTQKSSSNNAFRHSFVCALREGGVLAAVYTVILYLSWAFSGLLMFSFSDYYDETIFSEGSFAYLFDPDSLLSYISGSQLIVGIVTAFAFITGIVLFRFAFSKSSANVYRSLGVSAKELFTSRFLAGALIVGAPVVISMLSLFICNIFAGGFNMKMAVSGLYILLSVLAGGLTVFAITACVCVCSGHFVEAVVFSAVLNFLPKSVAKLAGGVFGSVPGYIGANENMSTMFIKADDTMLYHGNFSGVQLPAWQSHVALAENALERYSTEYGIELKFLNKWEFPNFLPLVCWLLAPALLCILGVFLLKKNRSENCGTFGKNRSLDFLVSATVVIGLEGLKLTISSALGAISFAAAVISALIEAALCFLLIQLILIRKKKPFVKELKKLPIFLGAVLVIMCGARLSGIGYTKALPNIEDVSSVYVNTAGDITDAAPEFKDRGYVGLWSNPEYQQLTPVAGDITNESQWLNKVTLPQDKEKILAIHQMCIDDANSKKENPVYIVFYYEMNDGSHFVRRFAVDFNDDEQVKTLLGTEDTEWYKKRVQAHLTGDAQIELLEKEVVEFTNISGVRLISKNALTSKNISIDGLPPEKMAEFMSVVADDLEKRTAAEKYFSEDGVMGFLAFYPWWKTDLGVDKNGDWIFEGSEYELCQIYNGYIYDTENTLLLIPITSGMQGTLNYLKQYDLEKYLTDDCGGNIVAARATEFVGGIDSQSSVFLSTRVKETTDDRNVEETYLKNIGTERDDIASPEQITELFEKSRSYAFASDGYIVSFRTDTGDVIFRYLPAESAPDYIK